MTLDLISDSFSWSEVRTSAMRVYRGCGEFFTAFWPYLRHLYPSSMISTSLRV